MKLLPILPAVALVLSACNEQAPPKMVGVPPQGRTLAKLVEATGAPRFEPPETCHAEALLRNGSCEIFHQGIKIARAGSEEERYEAFKQVVTNDRLAGIRSRVLVSAAGNTRFSVIRGVVQSIGSSGIDQVDFLVRMRSP